ncbi:MAG TPA: N-formylglutamate deformylase [Candidimonas sp.]|nr:N-formylglutamate deformylase [Candidimonas sp.]
MTATDDLPVLKLKQGTSPLLISIPHLGAHIPDDITRAMTPTALFYDDTDWHLDRLYSFAESLGASVLMPTHSRYVIDLNRPPDGANLYPGRNTTGLCPIDTFNEEALYLEGENPDQTEQERRRDKYWHPYHSALQNEIQRIKAEHGRVLLWEAHSIRSHVPRFFEGRLPDFNFGTADDASAAPGLAAALSARINQGGQYSAVGNGRFKGGYITRQYGNPAENVHAVQLELAQITYMDETRPYAYDEARANAVAPVIQDAIEQALVSIQ